MVKEDFIIILGLFFYIFGFIFEKPLLKISSFFFGLFLIIIIIIMNNNREEEKEEEEEEKEEEEEEKEEEEEEKEEEEEEKVQIVEYKSIVFEKLKKLIENEIRIKFKNDIIKSKKFSEMLNKSLNRYKNKVIDSDQIVKELVEIERKMRKDGSEIQKLDFSKEEENEKQNKSKIITNKSPAESLEDIQIFWRNIRQQKIPFLDDVDCGASISTENYSLFQRFIYNTKKELIMSTNVFSNKTLIELLYPIKNKNIKVIIITAREKDKRYDAKGFFLKDPLKLKIIFCPKNHSKIAIRDNSKVLIGSSNLDNFSLHQALETNMVSQGIEEIQETSYLLKSIIKNKDLRLKKKHSNIVYSGTEDNNLPFIIKELLKQEKGGLTILMSLQLFNVKILKKIEEWNINHVKINVELSNRFSKGEENAISKETYLFLREQRYSKDINLRFNKETIHSKVYQFHSQKKTLISSLNMTPNSWSKSFEAGILSENLKDYFKIQRKINSLNKDILILKDIAFETSITPVVWKQYPKTKDKTDIPWDLPEFEEEFQFIKENQKVYFKKLVNKNTLKEKNNEKSYDTEIHSKKTPQRVLVNEKWFMQTHPELFIEKDPQLFDSIIRYKYHLNKKNYETKLQNNNLEVKDNKSGTYLILLSSFNKSNKEIMNLLKRYDKLLFISDKRKSKKKIIQESNGRIIQLTKNQFEKKLFEIKPQS